MSASSYLASRFVLIWIFLSGSLRSARTSLSAAPFSCHLLADRRVAGSTLRQHVCLSLLEEVEGCHWLVAWAPAV
jgi:hypothetical protein